MKFIPIIQLRRLASSLNNRVQCIQQSELAGLGVVRVEAKVAIVMPILNLTVRLNKLLLLDGVLVVSVTLIRVGSMLLLAGECNLFFLHYSFAT